jgi:16S rRNA (guanine(966)-N(2))-methyltransferase RsmD
LFAGTGNVSLEALSRGAMRTVMIDKEPACLKVMARNLEHLGFTERAKVLKGDILKGVAWLGAYGGNEGYGIIFMGPPYRDTKNRPLNFTDPVLASIAASGVLAKDGIIVAQHHQNEIFNVPFNLEIYREEKYGDTLIHFLKYKTDDNK